MVKKLVVLTCCVAAMAWEAAAAMAALLPAPMWPEDDTRKGIRQEDNDLKKRNKNFLKKV